MTDGYFFIPYIYWFIYLYFLGPPAQDYYIFTRGSRTKASFPFALESWEGGQPNIYSSYIAAFWMTFWGMVVVPFFPVKQIPAIPGCFGCIGGYNIPMQLQERINKKPLSGEVVV